MVGRFGSAGAFRSTWLGALGGTLLVAAAMVGIWAALAHISRTETRESLERYAAELDGSNRLLLAAIDSTDARIAAARHLIGWMNEEAVGGSFQMMRSLRLLSVLPESPGPVPAEMTLIGSAWPGTSRAAAEMLAGITRMEAARERAERAGRPAHEHFVTQLEQQLPAAEWAYLFELQGSEGKALPLDYRGTLAMLAADGFDRELRTVLRGLFERRHALLMHQAECESLLRLVDSLITGAANRVADGAHPPESTRATFPRQHALPG